MRSIRLESRAMPNGRCRMHGGTSPGARRQLTIDIAPLHAGRPAAVLPSAVRLQPLTHPPDFHKIVKARQWFVSPFRVNRVAVRGRRSEYRKAFCPRSVRSRIARPVKGHASHPNCTIRGRET